ncbi:hypothetical protein AMTR_s00038p00236140 [Amborella trichopoda]|uniref:Uncharacterized protein n=1 Tax=Amborella trichopoda TaxID=13333 RepID=U5D305_AMBTC|nr:hypothetical protein AMTR_s00038p00236140 [Amborella trichopoda]
MDVQTKDCLDLVYLEVCILKKLEPFKKNQDPADIAGLERVFSTQRKFLSYLADEILMGSMELQKKAMGSRFNEEDNEEEAGEVMDDDSLLVS